MIRRPDSMLAGDPVARELGFEYGATMPRLGIEAGDARALAAFLAAPGDVDMPTAPGNGSPGCRHRAGHGGSPRSTRQTIGRGVDSIRDQTRRLNLSLSRQAIRVMAVR